MRAVKQRSPHHANILEKHERDPRDLLSVVEVEDQED
jgi:hypothetical protein